jgi:hypothetical protein
VQAEEVTELEAAREGLNTRTDWQKRDMATRGVEEVVECGEVIIRLLRRLVVLTIGKQNPADPSSN